MTKLHAFSLPRANLMRILHSSFKSHSLHTVYPRRPTLIQLFFPRCFFASSFNKCCTAFRDLLPAAPPSPAVCAACPPPREVYDSRLTLRATLDLPRSSRRAWSRRPTDRRPGLFLALFETLLARDRSSREAEGLSCTDSQIETVVMHG